MHEEVELQYATEHRLVARASVWEDDPDGPVPFLLDAIARERPARVLDAGCGPGRHGERIARVGRSRFELPFSRENGEEILRRPFRVVERHDFTTRARFRDREAVVRSVSSMTAHVDVPADIEPFEAHGEPTVFLARK